MVRQALAKVHLQVELATQINGEIINADMAQLYKPLSIGTAKPDWQTSSIPHHLFDVIAEPTDCTVMIYRTMAEKKVKEIVARRKIPIIVGGSGLLYSFVIFCAFRRRRRMASSDNEKEISWDLLNLIDPIRAQAIHPNDKYSICPRPAIWRQTGKLPSQAAQLYCPLTSSFTILHCTREKEDLQAINNRRTMEMIENGWLDECKKLIDCGWESFVRRKKFIGYSTAIRLHSPKIFIRTGSTYYRAKDDDSMQNGRRLFGACFPVLSAMLD